MVQYEKLTEASDEMEVVIGESSYGQYKIETIRGPFPSGVKVGWNNDEYKGEVDSIDVDIIGESGRGRMVMMQREDRMHLWHLYVPPRHRGKGVGSTLIKIFKQVIDKTQIGRVSGRVGNGHTEDFLIDHGFPADELEEIEITKQVSEPMKSVAIGGKHFAIDSGPDEALEQYPGFKSSKME